MDKERIVVVSHVLALVAATPPAGVPTNGPEPIPGLDSLAGSFIGWIKWILVLAGVAGLMVCGIMMAVGRRNRSSFAADGAAGIPWVLGGLTLGVIAAAIVSFFAI